MKRFGAQFGDLSPNCSCRRLRPPVAVGPKKAAGPFSEGRPRSQRRADKRAMRRDEKEHRGSALRVQVEIEPSNDFSGLNFQFAVFLDEQQKQRPEGWWRSASYRISSTTDKGSPNF